jgi:hypothetical protein
MSFAPSWLEARVRSGSYFSLVLTPAAQRGLSPVCLNSTRQDDAVSKLDLALVEESVDAGAGVLRRHADGLRDAFGP